MELTVLIGPSLCYALEAEYRASRAKGEGGKVCAVFEQVMPTDWIAPTSAGQTLAKTPRNAVGAFTFPKGVRILVEPVSLRCSSTQP